MAKRVFTQTFGVAAALIERDGQFLLVQEASGRDKGQWNHPGGWIDVGEDPVKSVIREVREETGYGFRPTALLGLYSLVRNDFAVKPGESLPHAIKLVFIGEISAEPTSQPESEVSEIRWFKPAEIAAMDQQTLRDRDIKQMVKDYATGQRYSLEVITHSYGRDT